MYDKDAGRAGGRLHTYVMVLTASGLLHLNLRFLYSSSNKTIADV